MISQEELICRLRSACFRVIGAQEELTSIDLRFGDGDHGLTMTGICTAILKALEHPAQGIRFLLDQISSSLMHVSGSSAVPLWYAWLEGMQAQAPMRSQITEEELKNIFSAGCQALCRFSNAKAGDKTLMDVLIPATQAALSCTGDSDSIFVSAARAAVTGADSTRNFVARFGLARDYGLQTLGTPDAGAVSLKYFFLGLAYL